jgi:hypothetical protein
MSRHPGYEVVLMLQVTTLEIRKGVEYRHSSSMQMNLTVKNQV